MGIVAQFDDITFEITSTAALLIGNIKLSAENETEEKAGNMQKYVATKNGKPVQADFEVEILAAFGQDVRQLCIKFLDRSQRGKPEYFYVGGEKLFRCRMMMTKAEVGEIEISPSGQWERAKISVTMKQAGYSYLIPDPVKEKAVRSRSSGRNSGGSTSKKTPPKTASSPAASTNTQGNFTGFAVNSFVTTTAVARAAKAATSAVTKTSTNSATKVTSGGLPNR